MNTPHPSAPEGFLTRCHAEADAEPERSEGEGAAEASQRTWRTAGVRLPTSRLSPSPDRYLSIVNPALGPLVAGFLGDAAVGLLSHPHLEPFLVTRLGQFKPKAVSRAFVAEPKVRHELLP